MFFTLKMQFSTFAAHLVTCAQIPMKGCSRCYHVIEFPQHKCSKLLPASRYRNVSLSGPANAELRLIRSCVIFVVLAGTKTLEDV